MRNWFTRGFGEAAADIRRELIENAWFGRAEPRSMGGHDHVLADKLYPDKIGERGFLGWLEANSAKGRDHSPTPACDDARGPGIDR